MRHTFLNTLFVALGCAYSVVSFADTSPIGTTRPLSKATTKTATPASKSTVTKAASASQPSKLSVIPTARKSDGLAATLPVPKSGKSGAITWYMHPIGGDHSCQGVVFPTMKDHRVDKNGAIFIQFGLKLKTHNSALVKGCLAAGNIQKQYVKFDAYYNDGGKKLIKASRLHCRNNGKLSASDYTLYTYTGCCIEAFYPNKAFTHPPKEAACTNTNNPLKLQEAGVKAEKAASAVAEEKAKAEVAAVPTAPTAPKTTAPTSTSGAVEPSTSATSSTTKSKTTEPTSNPIQTKSASPLTTSVVPEASKSATSSSASSASGG